MKKEIRRQQGDVHCQKSASVLIGGEFKVLAINLIDIAQICSSTNEIVHTFISFGNIKAAG